MHEAAESSLRRVPGSSRPLSRRREPPGSPPDRGDEVTECERLTEDHKHKRGSNGEVKAVGIGVKEADAGPRMRSASGCSFVKDSMANHPSRTSARAGGDSRRGAADLHLSADPLARRLSAALARHPKADRPRPGSSVSLSTIPDSACREADTQFSRWSHR